MSSSMALWDVALAVVGGAVRVGTPFLFVSLGECLTEKAGRINLGLEGVLVFSAMAGFGGAYLSGLWWVGVLAAGLCGALLALLHGLMCSLRGVNDIAAGIAVMLFGAGLAFYLGKPLIQPQAPQIPSLPLGEWSSSGAVASALRVNVLFPLGLALALRAVQRGALVADATLAAQPPPQGGAGRTSLKELGHMAAVFGITLFYALVLIGTGLPFWLATFAFITVFVGLLDRERQARLGRSNTAQWVRAAVYGAAWSAIVTLSFQHIFLVRLP